MKKTIKIVLYLLLAVPVIFIGCKKSEITDVSQNAKENTLKSVAYCGTTTSANLYGYGNTAYKYGTVTVGNDLNNLYVTYNLEPGWTFCTVSAYRNGCYLFIGSESEVEAMYPTNEVRSDGTGHFNYSQFRHTDLLTSGLNTYTYTIPRSEIKENCPIIVAFAAITSNGTDCNIVSARSLLKGPGYWFTHCMQYCKCETAYAFGGTAATCFISLPNVNSSNWGWSNKITGDVQTIHWPIYAGAGQCNITKGKLVGYLDGSYLGGLLNLTYNITSPNHLGVTHLYIGTGVLPMKNGKYVTAPGQFPYSGPIVNMNIGTPFYVAAHSEVCW